MGCPTTSILGFLRSRGTIPFMKSHKLRRTFEDVQDSRGTAQQMTVLQWNVLADGLAQYGEFERVRSDLLSTALGLQISSEGGDALVTFVHNACKWQFHSLKTIAQVPRDILAWERRAPQLLEEILDSNSDLIALQEVNRYGMPTTD